MKALLNEPVRAGGHETAANALPLVGLPHMNYVYFALVIRVAGPLRAVVQALTMLFGEVDFLDRFTAAAKAGFQGVEYLFPYEYDKSLLREKLQDSLTPAARQYRGRVRPEYQQATRRFATMGAAEYVSGD